MALTGRDPGLQAERTALAWRRTALAVAVNGLLTLRAGATGARPSLVVLGAALLAVAVAAVAAGAWRHRDLARETGPVAPPAPLIAATTAAVWLACAAGVATIAATGGG